MKKTWWQDNWRKLEKKAKRGRNWKIYKIDKSLVSNADNYRKYFNRIDLKRLFCYKQEVNRKQSVFAFLVQGCRPSVIDRSRFPSSGEHVHSNRSNRTNFERHADRFGLWHSNPFQINSIYAADIFSVFYISSLSLNFVKYNFNQIKSDLIKLLQLFIIDEKQFWLSKNVS